mmetsp:Transcript_9130/g.22577  ORF Transcript_9130/g.22577 Transcript_9130/m.22577 type:complete len:270 (+) Transcript_9130:853-1662(+)
MKTESLPFPSSLGWFCSPLFLVFIFEPLCELLCDLRPPSILWQLGSLGRARQNPLETLGDCPGDARGRGAQVCGKAPLAILLCLGRMGKVYFQLVEDDLVVILLQHQRLLAVARNPAHEGRLSSLRFPLLQPPVDVRVIGHPLQPQLRVRRSVNVNQDRKALVWCHRQLQLVRRAHLVAVNQTRAPVDPLEKLPHNLVPAHQPTTGIHPPEKSQNRKIIPFELFNSSSVHTRTNQVRNLPSRHRAESKSCQRIASWPTALTCPCARFPP